MDPWANNPSRTREAPSDLSAADLPAIPDRAWRTLSAHAGREITPDGGR